MVSAAVAGDDLETVAGSASDALGRPVAIAVPALGAPIVWPPGSGSPKLLRILSEYAAALMRGESRGSPRAVAESVPVRIGREVVGIVAALGRDHLPDEHRAWLEATAAAAAVAALMREAAPAHASADRSALIGEIAAGPAEAAPFLARARKLGFDLNSGGVAICARGSTDARLELPAASTALLADAGRGRVLGLAPLSGSGSVGAELQSLVAELEASGLEVALSGPRRDPASFAEALREAELLAELGARPDALLPGQEETYRLLIGVLLREPQELERLRERTIGPLSVYDREHDTELVSTLQAFLARHGSTTETAEVMRLHRHTVGYRLSRVHEVSGLSPYETDGRERLSLGLKAHQILEAYKQLTAHE